MKRRTLLAAAPGAVFAAALAGCGFELKRPPELRLKTLHLAGFAPMSAMAAELQRQLRASPQVRLVEVAAQAEVVLYALEDVRERVVAASTATGQVRELTLRARLRFRAANAAGRELIPPTELVLNRDMSYTETTALAKEQEADILYRSMQADIATQVLRRLAALNGTNGTAGKAATPGAAVAAGASVPAGAGSPLAAGGQAPGASDSHAPAR